VDEKSRFLLCNRLGGGGVSVCWSVSAIDEKSEAFWTGHRQKEAKKERRGETNQLPPSIDRLSSPVCLLSVRLYVPFYALFSFVEGNGILIVFVCLLIRNKSSGTDVAIKKSWAKSKKTTERSTGRRHKAIRKPSKKKVEALKTWPKRRRRHRLLRW
jgi:hypothetical protein